MQNFCHDVSCQFAYILWILCRTGKIKRDIPNLMLNHVTTTQIHKGDVILMVTFYSYIVNFIIALGLGFSKLQNHHVFMFIHGNILTDGKKTVFQIRRPTMKLVT